jgi:hypothetical protein
MDSLPLEKRRSALDGPVNKGREYFQEFINALGEYPFKLSHLGGAMEGPKWKRRLTNSTRLYLLPFTQEIAGACHECVRSLDAT